MSNQRPWERTFGLILIVLITAGCGGRQAEPTATSTPIPLTPTPIPPTPIAGVTIFMIGLEDESYGEFTARGFRDHREYTCRVGVDCSTETFPNTLCRDLATAYPDEQVKRVTIMFPLDQDYGKLLLRLARGGSETTVVTVDGQQTHLVTNTMLGSRDGWIVGAYNLMLGALEKGTHTLELTVADDGKGDGCLGWDALVLLAR